MERLLVQVSPDPDRRLWSLWAAKEAAFKALRRHDSSIVFSPTQFAVEPETSAGRASVVYSGQRLSVVWFQAADWVHALVWEGALVPLGVVKSRPDAVPESVAVRNLAVQEMQRAGYRLGSVMDRPPVYREAEGGEYLVSLSHDGPYSAVAFFPRTAG